MHEAKLSDVAALPDPKPAQAPTAHVSQVSTSCTSFQR